MTIFTIDRHNNVTTFAQSVDALGCGADAAFATEKEFAKLTAKWPLARFTEIWNGFAGVVPFAELKPVKKFTNRFTATARIWRAIQALTPAPAQHNTPKPAKKTRVAKAEPASNAPREGSKKALVLELLRREGGATLDELMRATEWQAHSVRGFLSGAIGKKMGLAVTSTKRDDGERVYRIA